MLWLSTMWIRRRRRIEGGGANTGAAYTRYDRIRLYMMTKADKFGDDVATAFKAAAAQARADALAAGVPVFYRDSATGLEVVEQPSGRKFEIRYIPGAPRDRNYEILRELGRSAA